MVPRVSAIKGVDYSPQEMMTILSDKTQITIAPQDQQVVEGTRIDLRCEATADPTLELRYYWKRDNAVIVYNSKFQWLASQNVLTIIDITVHDAGVFTCVAYTPEPKKSEDTAAATIDIAGNNIYFFVSNQSYSVNIDRHLLTIGSLSSDDGDASSDDKKTIIYISLKTWALHLRHTYKLWYILTLFSSAKQ